MDDCNVYITISQPHKDKRVRVVVDRQYKDGSTTHHVHNVLAQIRSYVYKRLPKILDKATSVRYHKGDRELRGKGWATQYYFKNTSKRKIPPEFPSITS